MLQPIIIIFILLGIYKIIDRNHHGKPKIIWWLVPIFVLISSAIALIIQYVIMRNGVSLLVGVISYLFYFATPFILLKIFHKYTSKQAVRYSMWVPLVALIVDVGIGISYGIVLDLKSA